MTQPIGKLLDGLTGALGGGIGLGHCRIERPGPIQAQEADAVARATPDRRAEFAAGRTAARRAMVDLGAHGVAIPMGPDRAPVWPAGFCGAITHHAGHALAIVGRSGDVRGLGLDLVADEEVTPDIAAETSFGAEKSLPPALVVAAKEAAFKAVFPLSGEVLPFDAMKVSYSDHVFTARMQRATGPFDIGAELHGRITQSQGLTLASVVLRRTVAAL